ncbi:hypothetical protein Mlaev_02370 [Microbacterium laevaniformans]|uniref:Uncharacterized protein n=1 Tax=Microbacterium laevaniformans TaxID=36807 RepID=A0A150HAW4_9MICO|nr:hypothetical protein [Microbacterium laevaniformans]KXZ59259.1 hypothetical protein Mlaev_02370 [Microbacterium laevaniformans]
MSEEPVNGQTVMSGTSSGRFAIDACKYTTEAALQDAMPLLAAHLRRTVKPLRDAIKSQIHETRYWAFWDRRERLFEATAQLRRFITLTGNTRVPVFLFASDHRAVYSDKVIVIASDDSAVLGVLSSAAHTAWFETMRTSRGTTSNYVVSRVLRTFPFPFGKREHVKRAADEFLECRSVALDRHTSPTKLYRMVDDPDISLPEIVALRDAQVALDKEVAAGYGWDDLRLVYGFEPLANVRRFTVLSEGRHELRRRLLVANHVQSTELSRANVSLDSRELRTASIPAGALF